MANTLFDLAQAYLNQGMPNISPIFQPTPPTIGPITTMPVVPEEEKVVKLGGNEGFSVYNPDPNMTRTQRDYINPFPFDPMDNFGTPDYGYIEEATHTSIPGVVPSKHIDYSFMEVGQEIYKFPLMTTSWCDNLIADCELFKSWTEECETETRRIYMKQLGRISEWEQIFKSCIPFSYLSSKFEKFLYVLSKDFSDSFQLYFSFTILKLLFPSHLKKFPI